MRRLMSRLLVAGALALVWAPAPARADAFVVPWFGSTFSQGPDLNNAKSGQPTFGVSFGSIGGGGTFGYDFDFGYARNALGEEGPSGSNSIINLMANIVLGPAFTSQTGKGARPYVSFGVGLIRPQADGGTITKPVAAENDFGWNAAGGIMAYFTSHLGVRGDLRYFHTVNNSDAVNTITLKPGHLHFWRVSGGLIIQ